MAEAKTAPVYRDWMNCALEKKKASIQARIEELRREKKGLREEALRYGQQLGEASEEEYIAITRPIGENSKRRREIDLEEAGLASQIIEMPKLTIEGVERSLSSHRRKWKMQKGRERYSAEELASIISEIVITNERITVKVDLEELLYGSSGSGGSGWMLEIVEDREKVSLGYDGEGIDFTSRKLVEAFQRYGSSRAE